MPRVVLDKSIVQWVQRGFFEAQLQSFDFLLSGNLLLEILTEGFQDQDQVSRTAREKSNQIINANLEKVVLGIGNAWLLPDAIIRHEITTGESGRAVKPVPLAIPRAEQVPQEGCRNTIGLFEDIVAVLTSARGERSAVEMPEHLAGIRGVAQNDRRGFFSRLEPEFLQRERIPIDARRAWEEFAKRHRFGVHPDFEIVPGYLCFGMSLIQKAAWYWAHWLRDEGPIDMHNPPNTFYDAVGVAYMSIADGLVAKDEDMLHFAWACWPEKREHIYTYNQDTREIERFVPEWER